MCASVHWYILIKSQVFICQLIISQNFLMATNPAATFHNWEGYVNVTRTSSESNYCLRTESFWSQILTQSNKGLGGTYANKDLDVEYKSSADPHHEGIKLASWLVVWNWDKRWRIEEYSCTRMTPVFRAPCSLSMAFKAGCQPN